MENVMENVNAVNMENVKFEVIPEKPVEFHVLTPAELLEYEEEKKRQNEENLKRIEMKRQVRYIMSVQKMAMRSKYDVSLKMGVWDRIELARGTKFDPNALADHCKHCGYLNY